MPEINLNNLPDKKEEVDLTSLPYARRPKTQPQDSSAPERPPNIYLSGLPDTHQSFAKDLMNQSWQIAQDIGSVYPVLETAAYFYTLRYGLPLSGAASAIGLAFGEEASMKAKKITENLLIYTPKTKRGKHFSSAAAYPFEALMHVAKIASDHAFKKSNSPALGALVYTATFGLAAAALEAAVLPKPIRDAIKSSKTLDEMPITQRALVVQSLEETLNKNPKMTVGELVKGSDQYYKEFLAKVSKVSEEKPVAGKESKLEAIKTAAKEGKLEPVFDEILQKLYPEAKKYSIADLIKPPSEAHLSEYKNIASEAARRAVISLEKKYGKEDIAALREAKKLAKSHIEAAATWESMDDAFKNGKINKQSMIDANISKEDILKINKKRPALITQNGKILIDNHAKAYGFDSVAALVKDWVEKPTKKVSAQELSEKFNEGYKRYIEQARDLDFNEQVINEEIDILNNILAKKFGKKINLGEIKNITTADGLLGIKNQVKLAEKKAYAAGNKEVSKLLNILGDKIKQRETLLKKRLKNKQRKEIKKMVKKLKKIKTDKMSPAAAEPIRSLLDNLDLTRMTKKKRIRLEGLRKHLEENPFTQLPEGRLEELKRLDKQNISDIPLDDLRDIFETVMHHVKIEKLKNKIKVGRRIREKQQVVQDSISEMKPADDLKQEIYESQQIVNAGHNIGELVKNTFGIRMEHYDLVVEAIAGPNSTIDKVLYQGPHFGNLKALDYTHKAREKFHNGIKPVIDKIDKRIGEWLSEKVTIGRHTLTRNQRMELYRHSMSTDNTAALVNGGFGDKFSKTKNKVWSITLDEINKIIASLTPEELSFAGNPVTEFFDNQWNALNKVFYELNGYDLPRPDNYYPKDVMPLSRGLDLEKAEEEEAFKNKFYSIGVDKGMLKKRVNSKAPIYLSGLTYTLNKSMYRAGSYIGLEIPLRDAAKLLNNKDFRRELSDRYGEVVWKEIDKGLRDLAGEYKSYTSVEKIMLKGKNMLSTALLGFDPFIMLKQTLSYFYYLYYVKPQYMMKGLFDYQFNRSDIRQRHITNSIEYTERVEGGYSRDVADVFKAGGDKRLYGGDKTLREKGMGGIKRLDEETVSPGMQGAVLQVLDEFKQGHLSQRVRIGLDMTDSQIPGLSAADKVRLAYRYADYATERSQPMFTVEHRSSISRGTPVEQMGTMFGSATNQIYNMIRRSFHEYERAKTPEAKSIALKKIALVLFLAGVITPLGNEGVKSLKDKFFELVLGEKRKKRDESFAGKIAKDWASYVFFLRDIVASTVSKIERGTFLGYDVDIPVMEFPNTAVNAVSEGSKMITEKDKRKRSKASERFIDQSLKLTLNMRGLPYSPRLRKAITSAIKKTNKKK